MPPPSMFEQMVDMFASMDTDRDRVPDYRDCEPYNPKKHGIKPSKTMRERLKRLPIRVSDKGTLLTDISMPIDPVHILDPRARREHPKATTAALSTIKKHPGIVGQMEKTDPSGVTFLYRSGPDFGVTLMGRDATTGSPIRDVIIYAPSERSYETKKEYIAVGVRFIVSNFPPEKQAYHIRNLKEQAERLIFKEETGIARHKKVRKSMAIAGFHELKHVQQDVEGTLKEKQAFDTDVPYHQRVAELEAKEKAREELKKRLQKGEITPEMYNKILGLD